MADKSAIEWTDATWNPIVGCSIVSPGCTNCYAMKMAARIEKMSDHPMAQYVKVQTHYTGTTQPSKAGAVWTGKVALAPDHILTAPLRWKRGRKIFVNSMGDPFHESIPDEWIDKVFDVMERAYQHIYQVLTKRSRRMCDYVNRRYAGRKASAHIWFGVSTEDQRRADERIPDLLITRAAVRFISAEPLLGPLSLRWAKWDDWTDGKGEQRQTVDHLDGARRLDWVIVGGESGPNARPMHPQWARDLRDQCAEAGVPFFFKQWGQWAPSDNLSVETVWDRPQATVLPDGRVREWQPNFPEERLVDLRMRGMTSIGKKAAGRLLDGKEHNEFPIAREVTPS